MLKKYDQKKNKLMFTDTDSLCYEIKTDDVYKDLFQDKKSFENSNYQNKSEFFFDDNTKEIGKMKDEAAGMPIKNLWDFVVKCTLIKSITKPQKYKGISNNTIKKDISNDDYRDTLFSSTEKKNTL